LVFTAFLLDVSAFKRVRFSGVTDRGGGARANAPLAAQMWAPF